MDKKLIMVQPDVSEVERRLEVYEEACRSACDIGQWEPQRTALLDAVRAIVAERDALKHDVERLMQETKALKYSLQLDEELIGKIQQIISVLANRPEVSNG